LKKRAAMELTYVCVVHVTYFFARASNFTHGKVSWGGFMTMTHNENGTKINYTAANALV